MVDRRGLARAPAIGRTERGRSPHQPRRRSAACSVKAEDPLGARRAPLPRRNHCSRRRARCSGRDLLDAIGVSRWRPSRAGGQASSNGSSRDVSPAPASPISSSSTLVSRKITARSRRHAPGGGVPAQRAASCRRAGDASSDGELARQALSRTSARRRAQGGRSTSATASPTRRARAHRRGPAVQGDDFARTDIGAGMTDRLRLHRSPR